MLQFRHLLLAAMLMAYVAGECNFFLYAAHSVGMHVYAAFKIH